MKFKYDGLRGRDIGNCKFLSVDKAKLYKEKEEIKFQDKATFLLGYRHKLSDSVLKTYSYLS